MADSGTADALADENDGASGGEVDEAVPEMKGERFLGVTAGDGAVRCVGEDIDVDDGEVALDDPVEDLLRVVKEEGPLKVGFRLLDAQLSVNRAPAISSQRGLAEACGYTNMSCM